MSDWPARVGALAGQLGLSGSGWPAGERDSGWLARVESLRLASWHEMLWLVGWGDALAGWLGLSGSGWLDG